MLRTAGWLVNKKRVERLWRREGLKVPSKQPKRGRLWLNDGSCKRIAEHITGMVTLYPAGSGPESGVKTRALPEIWAQSAAFKSAADASIAESAKFAPVAAAGNLDAVKTGFKTLTDSCVGCHMKFRGPEDKK